MRRAGRLQLPRSVERVGRAMADAASVRKFAPTAHQVPLLCWWQNAYGPADLSAIPPLLTVQAHGGKSSDRRSTTGRLLASARTTVMRKRTRLRVFLGPVVCAWSLSLLGALLGPTLADARPFAHVSGPPPGT